MADYSPPAAHPIVRIGPRGGKIIAERFGKDGKPEFEYQRQEHQHLGAGPHREAPYQRPVQQSLFDAPRTLALKPPEEPRRRATDAPQGDLFGAPRTVAVAHPEPPSGSRVAKLAKPLPWAAVQHHEPEPAAAPAPKAEWKAPEPTPAAAKLEGQSRERKPDVAVRAVDDPKSPGWAPTRGPDPESFDIAETSNETGSRMIDVWRHLVKFPTKKEAAAAAREIGWSANDAVKVATRFQELWGLHNMGGYVTKRGYDRMRQARGVVVPEKPVEPSSDVRLQWSAAELSQPGEYMRLKAEWDALPVDEKNRRNAAGSETLATPARVNPDEVTAAEQRQRQEAAEESARRRRKPDEPEAPEPAEKLERQVEAHAVEREEAAAAEAENEGDGGKGGPKTAIIQTQHLKRFEKEIEALNKRARRLHVPELKWEEVPGSRRVETETHEMQMHHQTYKTVVTRQVCEVRLIGDPPQLAGWKFIAKAKETPNGGWIFNTAAGEEVPLKLRTREHHRDCDHCQMKRDRKGAYIVKSEKSGEHKTIGTSCVKDFLGGHDPEGAMNALTIWADANRILAGMAADDGEGSDGFGGGGKPEGAGLHRFLSHVAWAIRETGWVSKAAAQASDEFHPKTATVDDALRTLFMPVEEARKVLGAGGSINPEAADEELARKTIAWAKKKYVEVPVESLDTFGHNLRTVITEDYVHKDVFGMAAYLVRGYQREQGEILSKKRAAEAGHFGKPGEKAETDVTVIATREMEPGQWGESTLVTMETPDGHTLKWFASNLPRSFEQGVKMRVKFTVKKHDQYRGRPETTVSRVNLVGPAEGSGHKAFMPKGMKQPILLPSFKEGTGLHDLLEEGRQREETFEQRVESATDAKYREELKSPIYSGKYAKVTDEEREGLRRNVRDSARSAVYHEDWKAAMMAANESGARLFEPHAQPGVHFVNLDPPDEPGKAIETYEIEGYYTVGRLQEHPYVRAFRVSDPDGKMKEFELQRHALVVVGGEEDPPPEKKKRPRTVKLARLPGESDFAHSERQARENGE